PGDDPHADQETPRPGADAGTAPYQPGAQPAAAAERACEQQCQALSHCERSDAPVERGHPRYRNGNLLCPAQLPGAPHTLATNGLIEINSIIRSPQVRAPRARPAWAAGSQPSFRHAGSSPRGPAPQTTPSSDGFGAQSSSRSRSVPPTSRPRS